METDRSSGDGGSDGEEGDEVEKIVDKRVADSSSSSSTAAGQPEYKVRWKGNLFRNHA